MPVEYAFAHTKTPTCITFRESLSVRTSPIIQECKQRQRGSGVAYWLRHCATSRRPRDRFPVVSLGIFSIATEGSNQPLKMITRDFSWGKGGRCLRLKTYHPRRAERQENPGP
jgi:hypothetical protein